MTERWNIAGAIRVLLAVLALALLPALMGAAASTQAAAIAWTVDDAPSGEPDPASDDGAEPLPPPQRPAGASADALARLPFSIATTSFRSHPSCACPATGPPLLT